MKNIVLTQAVLDATSLNFPNSLITHASFKNGKFKLKGVTNSCQKFQMNVYMDGIVIDFEVEDDDILLTIIPQVVLDAVETQFPQSDVEKIKFENGIYEIVGHDGKKDYNIVIVEDGKIISVNGELILPQRLLNIIEDMFPGHKISKIKLNDGMFKIYGKTAKRDEFKIKIMIDGTIVDVDLDD